MSCQSAPGYSTQSQKSWDQDHWMPPSNIHQIHFS
ncbi:unnamed protein product, partial [Staurois parvus]